LAHDVKKQGVTIETATQFRLLGMHETAVRNAELSLQLQRLSLFPNDRVGTRRALTGAVIIGIMVLLSLSMLKPAQVASIALATDTDDPTPNAPQERLESQPAVERVLRDQNSPVPSAAPLRSPLAPPAVVGRPPITDGVVGTVTQATSDHYLESGFKEFQFGMSRAEVQTAAERNKIPPGEGGQSFYFEEGGLIGYERLYHRDNAGYLAKFRDLFGGALSGNLTEAVGGYQGSTSDFRGNSVATAARNESLLGRYYFPHTLAYLQATWGASAQGNVNSVFRQEHLALNVFDRRWADAGLERHVSECQDVLERIQQITAEENAGALKLSAVSAFLGAARKYEAPQADAAIETVKLLNAQNEPFVVVERALKDLYERPRGSLTISVHLPARPGPVNPLFKYAYLAMETDRCNSIVAQDVFPPRGTTIQTERTHDSHRTGYSWQTASGWTITVAPGGHFYLANIPEKQL